MHEASLINDFMKRLQQLAVNEQTGHITRINVWLGALSHMSASHFTDHFKLAAKGTAAEHAILNITRSDNIKHPDAQHIILESVEFEDETA